MVDFVNLFRSHLFCIYMKNMLRFTEVHLPGWVWIRRSSGQSVRLSKLSMDSLIFSAVRPTFQVKYAFLCHQRNPSDFPGWMDSLIVNPSNHRQILFDLAGVWQWQAWTLIHKQFTWLISLIYFARICFASLLQKCCNLRSCIFQVEYGFVCRQRNPSDLPGWEWIRWFSARSVQPSRLSMDSLVVSAVRLTFQVEHGFADSQRGTSDLTGWVWILWSSAQSVRLSRLSMDSLIFSAVRPTF